MTYRNAMTVGEASASETDKLVLKDKGGKVWLETFGGEDMILALVAAVKSRNEQVFTTTPGGKTVSMTPSQAEAASALVMFPAGYYKIPKPDLEPPDSRYTGMVHAFVTDDFTDGNTYFTPHE